MPREKESNERGERLHGFSDKGGNGCVKCGTCCRKGGPALHGEDKEMLRAGHIELKSLITIRRGELAFSPLSGRLEPLQQEIIKIAGTGREWTCCFFDSLKSSCRIYAYRPLECRLLKCWDTSILLSVVGKEILTRADILDRNDPIMEFIEIHEKECSMQMAEDLVSKLQQDQDTHHLERLTDIVHQDLAIRSQAVDAFGLSLGKELFLFGRPLFRILRARGFQFMISKED